MFNALKYTEILEQAGFTREQAEKSIKVLIEIMETNLATKQDLIDLKVDLKSEFSRLESEMKSARSRHENDIKLLKQRMTIKLGTIMVLGITLLTTLNKIL